MPETSLRVMSFNVRGAFHAEDNVNAWDHRAHLNVGLIRRHAPDLIGFQEAQSYNISTYNDSLTRYISATGALSIRQAPNYHTLAIYWQYERLALVTSGSFYLSPTPERWSTGWGATLVRAVNWVRFQDPRTGLEFIHANTHFDHESEDARRESAALVVERLNALRAPDPLPVILTGDFNAMPGSATYETFMAAGYIDTYTAAGHTQPVNTYHGFDGEHFIPWAGYDNLRIDWVLTLDGAQPWRTHSFQIITEAEPPVYPSDHYPVMAAVTLGAD